MHTEEHGLTQYCSSLLFLANFAFFAPLCCSPIREGAIDTIAGFHHITAIAGDPQRNLDFYARVLGQRFVKRTVNFDAPDTYHFYFADYAGSPGTVLTFFPWTRARVGVKGSGEAAAVAYNVPPESLGDWSARLEAAGFAPAQQTERFGERLLRVQDPDGMEVELVGAAQRPAVEAWVGGPVPSGMELGGFHSTTLQVRDVEASAVVLRELFGWQEVGREGSRTRYAVAGSGDPSVPGRIIDLLHVPDLPPGRMGAGIIHHVAFRTPDEAAQERWRALLLAEGFNVTPVRDRQYFRSIYFTEPNGVLYEIATDAPGFGWDEPLDALGETLKLPPWLEPRRAELEATLPPIKS